MGILLQRHYKIKTGTKKEVEQKVIDLTKRYKKSSLKGMGFIQVDGDLYRKDGSTYQYAGGYLKPVEE